MAILISFASLDAQEPTTKPPNYDEIRPLLNYVSTHGIRKGINEELFSQGEAAFPTLFFLFEEKKQIDRYWLVLAMVGCSHSQKANKKVADFLVKQLESTDFENERDVAWVNPTMRFLAETDPEQARRIARRILNTAEKDTGAHSKSSATVMMIIVLTEVGTMEDVECLKGWNFLKELEAGGSVRMQGDRAIEHIKLRTAKPQDYSDMRAMLKEWLEENDFIWPSRFIDEKLLAERKSFRAKGDDPFHVFTFLFNNMDDQCRELLLGFTNYADTQGRRAQVADFLAKKLEETDVEKWNAERWISHAFWALEKTDNERAKRLARKAMNSPKQEIQEKTIMFYRAVGTLEDVETVRNWHIQKAKSEGLSEDEQLKAGDAGAEAMKSSIKWREEMAERRKESARQREEREKEKK